MFVLIVIVPIFSVLFWHFYILSTDGFDIHMCLAIMRCVAEKE